MNNGRPSRPSISHRWYLSPTGEWRRRHKPDWRFVLQIAGAIVLGIFAGLGIAATMMAIAGAM